MLIPDKNSAGWKNAICKEGNYQFEFLGTKIILGRLGLKYRVNHTPQILNECVNELWDFFNKNSNIPKVQNDLKKLFG